MKILIYLFLTLILLSSFQICAVKAQENKTEEDSTNDGTWVTVEGQPALKFSTKNGKVAFVHYRKFKEEEAFAVQITNFDKSSGWLYVTPTKIIYEATDNYKKNKSFSIAKDKVRKAEAKGGIGILRLYHFYLKAPENELRFGVTFSPVPNNIYDLYKDYQKPILTFFERLIADFDTVVNEYKEKGKTSEAYVAINRVFREVNNLVELTSRYDRFTDLTMNSVEIVISMPSNPAFDGIGPTFSLIGSYNYQGKKQLKNPDEIALIFKFVVFEGNRRFYENIFNDTKNIIFLAENERFSNVMKQDVFRDEVGRKIEVVSTIFPYSTFSKIFRAKFVEMRVGTIEIALKEFQIEAVRKFLENSKTSVL